MAKRLFKTAFILGMIFFSIHLYAQRADKRVIALEIQNFFNDFNLQDTKSLKKRFDSSAQLQSVLNLNNGTVKVSKETLDQFLTSIGNIPETLQFEERIKKPKINLVKGMAHAFVPYQFYIDGDVSHCGVNSFIFVKKNKQWLISNIIDTRFKKDCSN